MYLAPQNASEQLSVGQLIVIFLHNQWQWIGIIGEQGNTYNQSKPIKAIGINKTNKSVNQLNQW